MFKEFVSLKTIMNTMDYYVLGPQDAIFRTTNTGSRLIQPLMNRDRS